MSLHLMIHKNRIRNSMLSGVDAGAIEGTTSVLQYICKMPIFMSIVNSFTETAEIQGPT